MQPCTEKLTYLHPFTATATLIIKKKERSNSNAKTIENEREHRKSIFPGGCPGIKKGCRWIRALNFSKRSDLFDSLETG